MTTPLHLANWWLYEALQTANMKYIQVSQTERVFVSMLWGWDPFINDHRRHTCRGYVLKQWKPLFVLAHIHDQDVLASLLDGSAVIFMLRQRIDSLTCSQTTDWLKFATCSSSEMRIARWTHTKSMWFADILRVTSWRDGCERGREYPAPVETMQ